MNKKIRAVVKHYEKNMKFESRFEQLSHKLDLIKDDTPQKSDVIVIRRKLIPAYMMSILVMALVTGLIGLQIGLGNLKIKTEYVNPIESKLTFYLDTFITTPIDTELLGEGRLVNFYIGMKDGNKYLLANLVSEDYQGNFIVAHGNNTFNSDLIENGKWVLISIDDINITSVEITFVDSLSNSVSRSVDIQWEPYFEYLDDIN